ncbi:hypothetical protein D9M68_1005990 [compost metagenome]
MEKIDWRSSCGSEASGGKVRKDEKSLSPPGKGNELDVIFGLKVLAKQRNKQKELAIRIGMRMHYVGNATIYFATKK